MAWSGNPVRATQCGSCAVPWNIILSSKLVSFSAIRLGFFEHQAVAAQVWVVKPYVSFFAADALEGVWGDKWHLAYTEGQLLASLAVHWLGRLW